MEAMSDLYIGNSVSFCVEEILMGNMNIDQVVCIISGTKADDIETLFEYYHKVYWCRHDREAAKEAFDQIWGRVIQPRMFGIDINISGKERWIKANCTKMEI